jgi:transposase
VCDGHGRPVRLLLTAGQVSDHRGAAALLDDLPAARALIADRGYDSSQFRTALIARGIAPCIPSTRTRKVASPYDRTLYRQRHKIENAFGRLKDWRRIATRYDRCAHTFQSAICIAAVVTFWLGK